MAQQIPQHQQRRLRDQRPLLTTTLPPLITVGGCALRSRSCWASSTVVALDRRSVVRVDRRAGVAGPGALVPHRIVGGADPCPVDLQRLTVDVLRQATDRRREPKLATGGGAVARAVAGAFGAAARPGRAHRSQPALALAQLPVDPAHQQVICRTDAGGTSHELAAACRARHVRFIAGVRLSAQLAGTVARIAHIWNTTTPPAEASGIACRPIEFVWTQRARTNGAVKRGAAGRGGWR